MTQVAYSAYRVYEEILFPKYVYPHMPPELKKIILLVRYVENEHLDIIELMSL